MKAVMVKKEGRVAVIGLLQGSGFDGFRCSTTLEDEQ
jgi:hypothetical protein